MLHTGAKQQKTKTKIRPPRKSGSKTEVNPEESWKLLSTAIHDIQNKNASKWSFEQLYRIAYNLVISKNGKFLYQHVRDEIVDHLEKNVRGIIEELLITQHSNEQEIDKFEAAKIINSFNSIWDDHLISIWLISQVVMYMDRTFTKENQLPLIYDVGLLVFQNSIVMHELDRSNTTIGEQLINVFINYFNLNRNGDIIDKFMLKSTISIFESLSDPEGNTYYSKFFEPELLRSSHEYYAKKVKELLDYQSGTIYVTKVIDLINDELARFQIFIPDQTTNKLKDLMYTDLVFLNIKHILKLENDGLQKWIETRDYDLLGKVYKLTSRTESTKDIFKECLKTIIIKKGEHLKEISKIQTNESQTTNIDIDEKKKKSLDGDIEMHKEVEQACSTFLNENNRVQEYLSLFIDDCIKKSLKDKSHKEVDEIFNESISIFRYIKDKDIFEKYYKNHLAKRLLNNKSISNELELMMINRLKTEAGSSFTTKLEGMVKDIKTSEDITKMYEQSIANTSLLSDLARMNGGREFEVDYSILTPNNWPIPVNKTMQDIDYVPALDIARASFEKFYHSTYNGRNLTWAPNMCTIDLKMNFPSKSYLINMPTLAAFIILTCFNDDDTEDGTKSLTFEEIKGKTKIPEQDLVRHLQSIAVAPKTRILKKVPMSRDIRPTDSFKNSGGKLDATSSTSKVESEAEHVETLASVQKSRELEVDAAIVRIMKARKSAKYQVLVTDVVRIIGDVSKRFRPQPSLVKSRIEELVEKEYLRRDADDRELFWYVA
ncbi:hypothetical protein JL09_g1259 [Pichia kudriavzevii]|uniref:Cullin family profile domain-containing protein n=1 Tax=Pichia kudriavzevii TaxID=4909 RepID=A0A099P5K9_PICKU|nr:hypothetical protein JL09_g1259 [Pichia kudriavzevii]